MTIFSSNQTQDRKDPVSTISCSMVSKVCHDRNQSDTFGVRLRV
jgi:hypothetical protein